MELQHFFAPTMREAMVLIKNSLGDQALICSQKKVTGGIEVKAGLAISEDKDAASKAYQQNNIQQQPPTPSPELIENEVAKKVFLRIENENQLLRSLLENQLSSLPQNAVKNGSPILQLLCKEMVELGFDNTITEELIEKINDSSSYIDAWEKLNLTIHEKLSANDHSLLTEGGRFGLIGPTGAGKTTCIAKLATKFAIYNGTDKIGLITTDFQRVGAIGQMETIGKVINAPVLSVRNKAEIEHALEKMQSKKLILIDTDGCSPKDESFTRNIGLLNSVNTAVKHLLVLPANYQQKVIDSTIKAFSLTHINGCIVTKIDESEHLSPLLSTLIRHKIPVNFMTNGQSITRDLMVGLPKHIIKASIVTEKTT